MPAPTKPSRAKARLFLRRSALCVLALLTLATIAAWTLSLWYQFLWTDNVRFAASIRAGAMVLRDNQWAKDLNLNLIVPPTRRVEWSIQPLKLRDTPTWWVKKERLLWAGLATQWTVPLWSILVLTIPPLAWLCHAELRARRRTRTGLCLYCGYDRRGLGSSAQLCPECGRSPPEPKPA
jgi:hypothetical protein